MVQTTIIPIYNVFYTISPCVCKYMCLQTLPDLASIILLVMTCLLPEQSRAACCMCACEVITPGLVSFNIRHMSVNLGLQESDIRTNGFRMATRSMAATLSTDLGSASDEL